ncbi:MAG: diguanylate cyclase [Lachnospiraceae bacterium]|nr:diguanylate cyclase [Lachnospiraceae bacterium]
MEEFESGLRRIMLKSIWIAIWVVLIFDIGSLIFLVMTKQGNNLALYLLFHVIIPSAANMGVYVFAKSADGDLSYAAVKKNRYVALAMMVQAGVISVFHADIGPLWLLPAVSALFSNLYSDEVLFKTEIIINYVVIFITAYSYVFTNRDRVTEALLFTGSAIVVSAIIMEICKGFMKRASLYSASHEEVVEQSEEYEKELQYDVLTKVYSRKYLMTRAEEHMKSAGNNNPVSVGMIDIDNFKKVNDTYGHENGDVVLAHLGEILRSYITDKVTVGRFGGEEFVIIVEGQGKDDSCNILKEMLSRFSDQKYDFTDNRITFSGGMVTVYEPGCNFNSVLHAADMALYTSKENGKNQITIGRMQ